MLGSTPTHKSQKEAAITGPSSAAMKSVSKEANNPSSAAMKSVSILRTQWGDLADEETDRSDEQEQILEGDIEEGSLFTPFMSRMQKKYNKKKHANKLNDTGVLSTFSEHIQTRSKKGVIKSNPKYL